MTALKHKPTTGSSNPLSPLDALSTQLKADMDATNALILSRMHSHIPLIEQLAAYLIAAGGKRIRPLLTLAAARATSQNADACGLAASVEFIHTATLLHDDVIDESAQRRGQASANTVFGNQSSVLVGDFLFARAFELMVESDDLRILEILSRAARIITEGEVLQMSLTGNIDLTLAQYTTIIEGKTAALFAAATHAGALAAKADDTSAKNWRDYGHHLGMAFQIVDDLMDYAQTNTQMGKEKGDDFREGKITLPVLLALQNANADEHAFWARTMQDHNQTGDDLAQACALIAKYDCIENGKQIAATHAQKAKTALDKLPSNPITQSLDELLDFVLTRDH